MRAGCLLLPAAGLGRRLTGVPASGRDVLVALAVYTRRCATMAGRCPHLPPTRRTSMPPASRRPRVISTRTLPPIQRQSAHRRDRCRPCRDRAGQSPSVMPDGRSWRWRSRDADRRARFVRSVRIRAIVRTAGRDRRRRGPRLRGGPRRCHRSRGRPGGRVYSGQAIVHTSGALPASVLDPARAAGTTTGSFHPLVAMADPSRVVEDLRGATIALEGDESLLTLLARLAEAVGGQPVRIPPGGKAAYHAAAVMAAGGAIGLLDGIAEVARGAGLDEAGALAVYLPLMRQSLVNAERLGIGAALTGPLARARPGHRTRSPRRHAAARSRHAAALRRRRAARDRAGRGSRRAVVRASGRAVGGPRRGSADMGCRCLQASRGPGCDRLTPGRCAHPLAARDERTPAG